MTTFDLLLQQTINGLSLGAMYSLLALGFTLVYGILELINFSHFNVFMVGSFISLFVLQAFGLSGQEVILTGLPLAGVLLATFLITMAFCGGLGVVVDRLPLRNVKGPAGCHHDRRVYILFNVILLTVGAPKISNPALDTLSDRRCQAGCVI
jgi:branched-chain amino acid transport system permease protein